MQQYDTVLKALLQASAYFALEQISGSKVIRWLPIELPKVQNLRMDLLGETASGQCSQPRRILTRRSHGVGETIRRMKPESRTSAVASAVLAGRFAFVQTDFGPCLGGSRRVPGRRVCPN
jgi:hypothetical protein